MKSSMGTKLENISCVGEVAFVGISLILCNLVAVSGTPFPVPRRPLPTGHKKMRALAGFESLKGQLSASTATEKTSITLSDGDTVLCIPIEEQPSLSHLDSPNIQLKPSNHPEPESSPSEVQNDVKMASQVFAKEIGKCPKGQIPMRTGRNSPLYPTAGAGGPTQEVQSSSTSSRQYVHHHAYTATTISHPPSYKGTEVVMNVWQPFVEPEDFSLAQLWVMNTGLSFTPDSINWPMNSIETGWQVYSDLYSDMRPRLFVYWTDDDSGNWWLQFNQDYVGYWPSYLFHSLQNTSDLIQWGGEVFDVRDDNSQTKTHMGSGDIPASGFRKAAYQRNLQYVAMNNKLYQVQDLQAVSTKPTCYTVSSGSSKAWGTHFYYGGRC
uniref:Neprosin PEP catalytic domain-containing protein n=1 Tax=Physcomitrium patens TaxID=3218 RepID=A0A7I4B554_PHYPA